MKNRLFVAVFLCLSLLGCSSPFEECPNCLSSAVDITAVVVDMDNKPMQGIVVNSKLPDALGSSNLFTDKQGQISLKFVWSRNSSSSWSLKVEDKLDLKTVNYLAGPYLPTAEKITITDTIRIDTLKTIKIRLKTNRTDANGIGCTTSAGYLSTSQIFRTPIARTFDFLNRTRQASPIDTVIQMRVYSKAAFRISRSMTFVNTGFTGWRDTLIKDYGQRDSVFVFEF